MIRKAISEARRKSGKPDGETSKYPWFTFKVLTPLDRIHTQGMELEEFFSSVLSDEDIYMEVAESGDKHGYPMFKATGDYGMPMPKTRDVEKAFNNVGVEVEYDYGSFSK